MTATTEPVEAVQTEGFGERVFGDVIATTTVIMASLGDRLDLFKTLHRHGPLISVELANLAGVDERYTREWLYGMTCAGYLEAAPGGERFVLPEAHVAALVDEGGPEFTGGILQFLPAIISTFEHLTEAFRHGGGVHQAEFDQVLWKAMERDSAPVYNTMLVQEWIPAVPEVQRKLEAGTLVADVGCGSGLALIRLAQAFPESRFVGCDTFPEQLARANANVAGEGLADQIRLEARDGLAGIEERFGVVTSFDVVHDATRPLALMRGIREALEPDGVYLMAEPNAGESLEENMGPIGTFLYGASLFYCMTTSLAEGGEGLGTAGLPESKVRALADDAGFGTVDRVSIAHPLYALYALRP